MSMISYDIPYSLCRLSQNFNGKQPLQLRKNVKKTIFLFSYGAKSVKMNLCYAQKEKKELIGGKI